MSQCDGTAMRVELFTEGINTEGTCRRNDLSSKSFVNLQYIDIINGHAGSLQGLPRSVNWSQTHVFGLEGSQACADNASQRLDVQLLSLGLAHHHDRRGAIIQRATISGRDAAVLRECPRQSRQFL